MEVFLGKWKSEASEGFEEYLHALGVALPLRKIASLQNPSVLLVDNGDGSFKVDTITAFKTHSVKFKIDEELDEDTPDGRKVKTTFTIEDGKLVQKQILNGDLSSQLIREIVDGKLKITATAGNAIYIRTYNKA